jgi:nuclear pore complex protein Nup210
MQAGFSHVTFSAFHASNPGKRIVSQPTDVQVFPPLRVSPREILLVPESEFQVDITGGPVHTHVALVFQPQNTTVMTTNTVGLIHAHAVGLSTLRVVAQVFLKSFDTRSHHPVELVFFSRSQMTNPATQELEVLSEDTVTVRVALLTGVRINAEMLALAQHAEIKCALGLWFFVTANPV